MEAFEGGISGRFLAELFPVCCMLRHNLAMTSATVTLPEDPSELRSFTTMLLAEVKAQAVLIEKLRYQLAGHRVSRFGSRSEAIEQLNLALEASEIAVAAMTARFKLPHVEPVDKPKRLPIPDHVPRNHIELISGDDACAKCGGNLRRLGEDVTEELEYVPGRFVVNRITRPRFACSGCEAFTQAALPSRPIDRGRPGPGLLAHVLVSKYADHLPLYRQSQIYDREGIDLDRSTHDRLGRQDDRVAGAARRRDRSPCAEGQGDLRGRHAGEDACTGHRQDADRMALDLRA